MPPHGVPRPLAKVVGLLSGSILLGGVLGAVLLITGIAVIVGLLLLAFYVMGDPCSLAAEIFEGGRPPHCEAVTLLQLPPSG